MLHKKSRRPQKNDEPKMDRRHLLRRGGLMAGVATLASAFSLTPISNVQAATQSIPQDKILKGNESAPYIQATIASPDYEFFKQQIQQGDPTSLLTIQEHEATVTVLTFAQEELIVVRIPVLGGLSLSAYAASFKKGKLAYAQGGIFSYTDAHNIHSVITRDHQIVLDATMTIQGYIVQGTMLDANKNPLSLDGLATTKVRALVSPNANVFQMICCIVGGLEILAGISLFVADLIAAVCAAACATLVGCIPCILGVAGVGSGLIGIIWGRCSYDVNSYGRCP